MLHNVGCQSEQFMMTSVGTRHAVQRDRQSRRTYPLSATLPLVFFDDPVFSWCLRGRSPAAADPPAWFAPSSRPTSPRRIYTTEDVIAGAVWVPPLTEDDAQLEAALGEISEEYAKTLFEVFELMAEKHPQEPHHYLFLLATRSEWQSCGIGSALMRPVLEMCDRDAMPAYLEATSERNRLIAHGSR